MKKAILPLIVLTTLLASCGQQTDTPTYTSTPITQNPIPTSEGQLTAQSPISWIAKRGFNKATKEILQREIKGVVSDAFGTLKDKKYAEFFQEASDIASLFEDPWWVQVIEVIPVGGDIYGGLRTTARLQEAARRAENLYANSKSFAATTRYLRQSWSNSDSELIGHYNKHARCFNLDMNQYLNLGIDVINSGVTGVKRADGTTKYTLSNGDFAITRTNSRIVLTAGKASNCPGY